MKFPRSAKIFRGQLDAAPLVGVLFLLVIFLLLSALVYTPGVTIELPTADGALGTDNPTLTVAVTPAGQIYYENQLVSAEDLKARLEFAVAHSGTNLTLLLLADKAVPNQVFLQISELARAAGIRQMSQAVRPRPFDHSSQKPGAP